MFDLPLGPIADAAAADPQGLCIVDSLSTRTWSQVVVDLRGAASAMLEAAPSPDARWGVMGDNFAPTVLAHAASLLAGVGAVAVSEPATKVVPAGIGSIMVTLAAGALPTL